MEKCNSIMPNTIPTVLTIITARGGSKGLPRKNILPLNGTPMNGYTIKAAQQSNYLSSNPVIVSTDDLEIARIARDLGADVPFIRPDELAVDNMTIYPVLSHALLWFQEHRNFYPDYTMLLQPTSPLRTSGDIDEAMQILVDNNADGVVSVYPSHPHPYLSKKIVNGRLATLIESDTIYSRRQDMPSSYTLNGALYIAKSKLLLDNQTFYNENTYPYIMPIERSIDIDSAWEMYLAEIILQNQNQ